MFFYHRGGCAGGAEGCGIPRRSISNSRRVIWSFDSRRYVLFALSASMFICILLSCSLISSNIAFSSLLMPFQNAGNSTSILLFFTCFTFCIAMPRATCGINTLAIPRLPQFDREDGHFPAQQGAIAQDAADAEEHRGPPDRRDDPVPEHEAGLVVLRLVDARSAARGRGTS